MMGYGGVPPLMMAMMGGGGCGCVPPREHAPAQPRVDMQSRATSVDRQDAMAIRAMLGRAGAYTEPDQGRAERADPNPRPNKKWRTAACWFHLRGSCLSGDDCRYSHDPAMCERSLAEEDSDLGEVAYKTELCTHHPTPRGCKFGRFCWNAHGEADLRRRGEQPKEPAGGEPSGASPPAGPLMGVPPAVLALQNHAAGAGPRGLGMLHPGAGACGGPTSFAMVQQAQAAQQLAQQAAQQAQAEAAARVAQMWPELAGCVPPNLLGGTAAAAAPAASAPAAELPDMAALHQMSALALWQQQMAALSPAP